MQDENVGLSRLHWNVAPASDEKLNEADVLLTVPVGPDPIVVVGPVVSSVNVRVAGDGSRLPTLSTARTWNV